MIGRLSGTLVEKNPPQILLDVQGVAYEVDVPMSTFYNLPNLGDKLSLFTHLVVREDAHLLFGFGSENERRAFRQLIKISGVGARTALSVLSGLSVAELAQAVTLQESGRLTKIPGIGKKNRRAALARTQGQTGCGPHYRCRRNSRGAGHGRRAQRADLTRLQRQGSSARSQAIAGGRRGGGWHQAGTEVVGKGIMQVRR
jgi:hypothetical protein